MESLIGKTLSHYRILEKLGEGGMGIIYRAEDLKLERTVALKVLTESFTQDQESKRRFIREAQSASSLQHNNICTIHEIDDTAGRQLFIAMDYYEGETLKQRLRRGRIDLDEVVAVARQLADGLKNAHDHGIIHRDVKPANIFLTTGGTVKILDFGLAKRKDRTQLTRGLAQFGTVDYMSPEQIKGEQVDQRTDIWSMGVTLYEMLAGRPPFQADYDQSVVYLILNQDPEDLRSIRQDIPEKLLAIVEKSMAKEPNERYDDMASVLRALQTISLREPEKQPRFDLPAPIPSQSIAVLPFVNLTADPEQELFCDGLTEELIMRLSRVSDLKVVASTSAFAFKGRGVDVRKAGRTLGVRTVLEGSVRRSGDNLRFTVQLINVADGYHLWSERYDRQLKDMFEVQDEISLAIVDALKIKILKDEKEKLFKRYTDNVEVYNLFQQGYYLSFHQLDLNFVEKAIGYFRQAIEKDPNFGPAYAGIAACLFITTYFGQKRSADVRSLMKQHIQKALAIDPNSSQVYHVLALHTACMEYKHAEAEPAYRRSLELYPNDPMALVHYSINRTSAGEFEYGRKLAERAIAIDPLSDYIELCVAFPDFYTARYDRVLERLSKFRDQKPAFLWGLWCLWRTYDLVQRRAEAVDVCKRAFVKVGAPMVAEAMEKAGVDHAFQAAALTMAGIYKHRYVSPYDIAILFAHAGRQEEALEWVGTSLQERDPKLHFLYVDPEWQNVRNDPRFVEYLKGAGYEAWITP